jgi:hypothetical protein
MSFFAVIAAMVAAGLLLYVSLFHLRLLLKAKMKAI